MILLGTFVFGVLVGCFIERHRLGVTSWTCGPDCDHRRRRPSRASCRLSCQTVPSRRVRCKRRRRSPFPVSCKPTESRFFVPMGTPRPRPPVRPRYYPPRRPRRDLHMDLRSRPTQSTFRSLSRRRRPHSRTPTPHSRSPTPHRPENTQVPVQITNIVDGKPQPQPQPPQKRWTDGMLFRRPPPRRRPKSVPRSMLGHI